jgi:hypothetical protein
MTLQEEQYIRTILSIVSTMIARIPHPVAIEGILASGSYNPQNSSAMSIRGDTFASTSAEEQLTHRNISIATAAHGDQYGPVGDERTILIPTQSGYVMLFEHGEDDSPGAPSGWRYINVPYGFRLKTTNGLIFQMDDPTGYAQMGAIGLDATQDAVVTYRYLHAAIEALRATVQTAFNALAGSVAGGSGITPPTVADVSVSGSSKFKAAP